MYNNKLDCLFNIKLKEQFIFGLFIFCNYDICVFVDILITAYLFILVYREQCEKRETAIDDNLYLSVLLFAHTLCAGFFP